MSTVRKLDGRKGNFASKKTTLADVRKGKNQTSKAKKALKEWTAKMQADLTQELKQVKTQQQLTNIEEMVRTYGSSKNREAFNKLQSTFRKEARMLIDTELATMSSKAQLESIRSMVELNGSAAQKEKFAQFESYYTKPTWEKYANLQGKKYTAPVSGVGEADRRAEQIIAENNLRKAAEEAKKADETMSQAKQALKASSRMDDFLSEGDKLIEQGKEAARQTTFKEIESYKAKPTWEKYAKLHGTKYTAPTSGVGEADRRAERIIAENNLRKAAEEAKKADETMSQTKQALKASSRMDDFLSEGDKLIEQGKDAARQTTIEGNNGPKVIKKQDTGKLPPAEPADAVEITSKGEEAAQGGKKAAKGFSKFSKFAKTGSKIALVAGVAALLYYGAKAFINKIESIPVKPEGPTDIPQKPVPEPVIRPEGIDEPVPVPVDTTETDSTAFVVPPVVPDSTSADTTAVVTPPVIADTTVTDTVAQTVAPSVPVVNPKYELSDEDVVASIVNNTKLDDSKFYVVRKGDCVWKLIEKRLEQNKSEYNLIKEFLTGIYGKTPSHNAIIRHATILTCENNGIRYIIDDQKLMPKDTLNIPEKFDVRNRFDTAA